MSTNGTGPVQNITLGGRRAIEQVSGARSANETEGPIQPGEMAYPIGGDPWTFRGLQDPSVMRTNLDVSLKDLKRMTQRDGHARAMLNVLTLPMRAATRVVEPDQDGEDEADFIRSMLEDPPHKGGMTTTMDYVLASAGLAHRDGFKVFEKVTTIRDTREGESGAFREVLRKLKPLPSETISFVYDEFGGFDGVVQTIYWNGEKRVVRLTREKCLLITIGKEESPLEGESAFLPAWYHYDKKHRLYYIAHIAAQAGATGFRVGKLAGGTAATRQGFLTALQNLGINGAAILPAQAEVEFFSTPNILEALLKLIEHHDVAMSKSILAHFLDVGTEGKGQMGTATTTSELGDLFVVALEAHMKNVAETITSYLIPYFIDQNFGSGKYPTFRFEPFSDEQKKLMQDTFKGLFNATAPPVPEMMFEMQKAMADNLGLEGIDWDALEQQFKAEQEQQRQIKDEAAKAQLEAIKNPPPVQPSPPGTPPGQAGNPHVPPPPKPVKLSDAEAIGRAITLAERMAAGRSVFDKYGMALSSGDRVLIPEEDSEWSKGKIYVVKEIVGSTLILECYEDPAEAESSDVARYKEAPFARPANAVQLLQ